MSYSEEFASMRLNLPLAALTSSGRWSLPNGRIGAERTAIRTVCPRFAGF
jgi:hypothetical protein